MITRKKAGVFLLAVAFAFLIGENTAQSQARRQENAIYQQLQLFSDVLSTIQRHYVDPVESQELISGALRGMLSSLDPYSQFLDEAMFRELEIGTEGVFGGVGMVITVKDGLIAVISPIEDTPAFRAGIRPDDRITRIGEESTRGMTSRDAADLLRGEPGTDVSIEVFREGEPEIIKITLTREIIRLQSVKRAGFIGESRIAYVRVTEFQKETFNDLRTALAELDEQDMEGLILDLRNNPGGLLTSAIEVTNLFLPPGKMIVYTQGRDEARYQEYRTRKNDLLIDDSVPMVVLINRGSASGSEILAGALADWNRAVLLGEKTFGKGSVQTVIPIRVDGFEGTGLKLTIAYYHTPKDRKIEGEGLTPDIEVPQEAGPTNVYTEEPDPENDKQLQRAFDLLRGLVLLRPEQRAESLEAAIAPEAEEATAEDR